MGETYFMNVLIACEESQRICKAFRQKGCNAFSCDLFEPSGGVLEWHIKGNALDIINGGFFNTMDNKKYFVSRWDLIIAHPPCTYLSKAGACRLYPVKGLVDPCRYSKGLQAKEFFMKIYNANCSYICIENPTPLKIFELPKPTQIIQPYQFGEPYSKRTLLWLKGLPKLKPTKIITEHIPYISCGTSKIRVLKKSKGFQEVGGSSKVRSLTFEGIALAMAEQWSKIL